jgi:hypothetical protein
VDAEAIVISDEELAAIEESYRATYGDDVWGGSDQQRLIAGVRRLRNDLATLRESVDPSLAVDELAPPMLTEAQKEDARLAIEERLNTRVPLTDADTHEIEMIAKHGAVKRKTE